jgi:subtilase family serine protease
VGAATDVPSAEASPRTPQAGQIVTPESSIDRAEDAGKRAHTNVVVRSLDGRKALLLNSQEAMAAIGPDTTTTIETPASLGCLYVSSPTKRTTGCVPNFFAGGGHGPSAAGWGAIALVDAYDNPSASQDLVAFDKYFGLKAAKFTKIYANGNGDCTTPPPNAGWALESSLDIEWAHVYAPNAQIVLVEACSNSYTDLLYAEGVAINYIQVNYGGGQVSNSWGSGEFSGENSYDPIFAGFNYSPFVPVVTFASAGDSGCGAAYPSSNPWLVSAGGTTVNRNSGTNTFNNESCWGGSGGGSSVYETYATSFTGSNTGPWADYQYPIFAQGSRQTPDLASDADPASGVAVDALYYGQVVGACTTEPCFFEVGGTSVASPSLAGIVNRANNRETTCFGNSVTGGCWFSSGENNLLYSQLSTATNYYQNFYDVTTGSNGCTVTDHWDYCTGVGSPRDLLGK